MPAIIEYFLKVSVSLAVVFLLYQLVFKRLTFYNWNRFYLLIYSALSFVIPFININSTLKQTGLADAVFIQQIPTLTPSSLSVDDLIVASTGENPWTIWDMTLLLIAVVIGVLLCRFFVQLFSLVKMIKNATLISSGDFNVYGVANDINPFSFGKHIFLNKEMHQGYELHDILMHEMVHVEQKHTIDIIWAELLCIINWYNPFVWLLKSSIKQNLEFIADDKVLQKGADKKTYQYLLLKVSGKNYSTLSTAFNFSSLKKRIAMMNLAKQTKLHLLKFLFILPLVFVVLLAFRTDDTKNKDFVTIAGIVFDETTLSPIPGVSVRDSATGTNTTSDHKGFYEMKIPRKVGESATQILSFYVGGNKYAEKLAGKVTLGERASVIFLGLKTDANAEIPMGISVGMYVYDFAKDSRSNQSDYSYVSDRLVDLKASKQVDKLIKDDPRPVHIIDGIPYVFGNGGRAWFNKEEAAKITELKVWVDGKIMSVEEANKSVNRFDYKGVAAAPAASMKELLGLDYAMMFLYKDSVPPFQRQ